MRLSDIMGHLGLAIYPIMGLVIFLTVFVFIVVGVCGRKRIDEFNHAADLPLADDAFVPGRRPSGPARAEGTR